MQPLPSTSDSIQPIENFDLSARNTLALTSHARFGAEVTELSQLELLVELSAQHGLPLHIIGGGSNLVLQEKLDAVVAAMAIKGRKIYGSIKGHVLVTANAGEDWSEFVEWTVEQGLSGLENLAGIPGTVGAAPVQNIGAYGLELKDRFHSLQAYDTVERKLRSFNLDDCAFKYRHSVFKDHPGRYIVTEVTFALPKEWHPVLNYSGLDTLPAHSNAETIMRHVLALRSSKLPDWRELPNVGSFFHNPIVSTDTADAIVGSPRYAQADGRVKLSAAWLIDQCGLKGVREGQAGIYDQHALIVVNHGGATYTDIAALTSRIKEAILTRFGIELTQEPIIL